MPKDLSSEYISYSGVLHSSAINLEPHITSGECDKKQLSKEENWNQNNAIYDMWKTILYVA